MPAHYYPMTVKGILVQGDHISYEFGPQRIEVDIDREIG